VRRSLILSTTVVAVLLTASSASAAAVVSPPFGHVRFVRAGSGFQSRSRPHRITVYATNSPRPLSRRTIRRRGYLAFVSFRVYRIHVPRSRAAAVATLREG
jgi:hypothetical protein